MNTSDVEKLMGLYAMECRRRAAASILVGNDTQCFTTEQYIDRYVENDKISKEFLPGHRRIVASLARMHLRSIKFKEVKPGVWAKEQHNG